MAFLNQDQSDQLLKSYNYVKPDGCYVILYKDEIKPLVWDNICQTVGLNRNCLEIKLFIVASIGS